MDIFGNKCSYLLLHYLVLTSILAEQNVLFMKVLQII